MPTSAQQGWKIRYDDGIAKIHDQRGRTFVPTEDLLRKMLEGIHASIEDAATTLAALPHEDDTRMSLLLEAKWHVYDALEATRARRREGEQ
jgi:hypothetical protein